VIVIYLLEAEFFAVIRILLQSVLIAIEPITLFTDVGSCMTPDLLELLICLVLLNHLLHMTLILLILPLTNMWLYKNISMILWFKRCIQFLL